MGNRVHLEFHRTQGCEPGGVPYGEPYWELAVWDDEESSTTFLGRDDDSGLPAIRERLVADQLGLITEYGAEGHGDFAREYGAYVCDDWKKPEELTEAGEPE